MREVIISEEALQDLKEHLSYIVIRDGIERAESINDQIIDKIYEIAESPIELGQRKDAYLAGIKRMLFKGVYLYFSYGNRILKIERIISRFRDQKREF